MNCPKNCPDLLAEQADAKRRGWHADGWECPTHSWMSKSQLKRIAAQSRGRLSPTGDGQREWIYVTCPHCRGAGSFDLGQIGPTECTVCGGFGKVEKGAPLRGFDNSQPCTCGGYADGWHSKSCRKRSSW